MHAAMHRDITARAADPFIAGVESVCRAPITIGAVLYEGGHVIDTRAMIIKVKRNGCHIMQAGYNVTVTISVAGNLN